MRLYLDYFWILLSKIIQLLIGLTSTIVLAKYFGPEQYGKYQYVISISILFLILINFGYSRVIVKEINSKRFEISPIIISLISLKLIGSAIILILGFFSLKLFYEHHLEYLFILILASYILSSFSLKLFFESRNENLYILIANIFSSITSLILKIYLVIIQADINLFGFSFILDIIMSNSILLFFFFKFKHSLKFEINSNLIKLIFNQSYPFALSTISGTLYFYVDRIMLGSFGEFSELGAYTIYILFFSYGSVISSSLSTVVMPKLIRLFNTNKKKYYFYLTNFLSFNFIFMIIISIFYIIFLETIIQIIYGQNFKLNKILIYFLAFSSIVNAGTLFFADYLLLNDKSILITYTRIITLLINVLLNYNLIPLYGIYGAALSSFVTTLIFSIFINFFNPFLKNYLILYFLAFKNIFINPSNVIKVSYNILMKDLK